MGLSGATRMLTEHDHLPGLAETAVCSMAHSSGASRLALVHRAAPAGAAGAARVPAAGGAVARPVPLWRRALRLGALLGMAGRHEGRNHDGGKQGGFEVDLMEPAPELAGEG